MRPHAEIAQVWPRDGHIRVVGDLVGELDDALGAHHGGPGERQGVAPDPGGADHTAAGWRLLLVLREAPEHRVSHPAPLMGRSFDVSVPLADLLPPRERRATPATWDLYLATGDGEREVRLRAGRLLDDIEGKKHIMVFPAQQVAHADGVVSVRPFYTVKDNLSVACRPVTAEPAGRAATARGGRTAR